VYCNSTDASYDLAEDEDFNSEMGNLMDADIGSQVGIFDTFHQGYASEHHMGESSSALTCAPTSTYDFDDGIYLNPAMFAALILMEVLNMPKKKWYEAPKKNLVKLQNEKKSDGHNLDGLFISVFFPDI
jgi:hypothetical protein